jgi:hypothetical protein
MRTSILATLLLLALPAHGTPGFPAAIQRELGTAQAPACALCHAGGVTGRGTVTTPFGQALRARGLGAGDEGSLARALAALELDRIDSDGDGVVDVDELRAGTDPNRAADLPAVEYGCALAGAGAAGALPALILAALALALRAARRRARG